MISRILTTLPQEIRGIGCMSAAAVTASSMNAVIREVSFGIHSFEIAFFRNVFGFFVLLPALIRQGRQALATSQFGLHLIRAGLNAIAMLSFFHAITITPLATVAALAFTSPLFATIFAIVILREKVGPRRWTGLFIGFSGAMLIIRPGIAVIDLGAFLVLLSSFSWGMALVIIKILGRRDSSLVITAYASLLLTPITALAAIAFWVTPNGWEWLQLAAIGLLGSLTQLAIAQAFREADASLVLPFDFTKIIWATLIGYWFFGEIPDPMTIIGGAVICSAVTYIAYREAQTAKLQEKKS